MILITLYSAVGAFALALALWDPSRDSLSAIYLVAVAIPWTFVVSWIIDLSGMDSYWFNMVFLGAGVLVNALLLYGLGRLVQRRKG